MCAEVKTEAFHTLPAEFSIEFLQDGDNQPWAIFVFQCLPGFTQFVLDGVKNRLRALQEYLDHFVGYGLQVPGQVGRVGRHIVKQGAVRFFNRHFYGILSFTAGGYHQQRSSPNGQQAQITHTKFLKYLTCKGVIPHYNTIHNTLIGKAETY